MLILIIFSTDCNDYWRSISKVIWGLLHQFTQKYIDYAPYCGFIPSHKCELMTVQNVYCRVLHCVCNEKWIYNGQWQNDSDSVLLFHIAMHHPAFSYTRQENPNGSVILDFSVWYCLSGTHFRCVSFKLICRQGYKKNNILPAVWSRQIYFSLEWSVVTSQPWLTPRLGFVTTDHLRLR